MRTWTLALLCCAALGSSASADNRDLPKNGKTADVSQCVQVRTEAIYIPYGYDHHVHVTNGCDKAVRCEVTTSATPEATTVTLAPREHKDLVTFRGSPASAVNAKVKCKLADAT